jgi:hypothetical protein
MHRRALQSRAPENRKTDKPPHRKHCSCHPLKGLMCLTTLVYAENKYLIRISLGAWAGVRRKRCLRMCMCQSFDRRGRGPWKKPCNCGSTSVTSAFLGLHLGGLNLVRRVQVRKFIVLPSFRILRIPVQKCIVVLCNRERLKTAKPISRRTGNTAVAIRSRA